MTWINQQGQIYEGDMQFGDREATQDEIKSVLKKQELTALAAAYKSDLEVLNSNWLAAAVADGPNEANAKTTVTGLVAARKTQWQSDQAAIIAKYK